MLDSLFFSLLFHSPHMAVPLQSFFCDFLVCLYHTLVPLMCSFRILSLLVTPHIHLSILISFTSSRAYCPLVVAQVSALYNSWSDHSFVNVSLQFHWHPRHMTLHCISSSFPMLHSLSVKFLLPCLLSTPRLNRHT